MNDNSADESKMQNCARDQFEKGFNIASSGNVDKFLKKIIMRAIRGVKKTREK
jgi:hypothetical protein